MIEGAKAAPETSAATDPIKPRMRGWLHLVGAIIALPFGYALIANAAPGPNQAGAALYAGALILLLATSGTYHTRTWSDRTREFLRLMDHSMIFILIGGSYSPFLLGIEVDWARVALPTIWTLVFLGILRMVFFPNINRWLKSLIYIIMGWMAVPMMGPFYESFGGTVLCLLLAGGLAFTGGAVIYTRQKPNPWPQTFGYHEIFHAGVIAGSICHYVAVWKVVS